ncbi:enhancer of yellow 2 transcription factor [Planococcus citri]|uniref:enhancer of yellow 2 transcription factor n=1 Tax=Planococcus citri TaxID=170843 RepID=UPI0031F87A63
MNPEKTDYTPIKQLLYRRLTESGWCDQVRMLVRLKLKENRNISVNELVESSLPKARGIVPAAIKREMLQKLKDEILRDSGYYDAEGNPS